MSITDNKILTTTTMSTQQQNEMMSIDWVSKNAKFIDFSQSAIDKSNEPDTEPESDTDYDTDKEVDYRVGECNLDPERNMLDDTDTDRDNCGCKDCYAYESEEDISTLISMGIINIIHRSDYNEVVSQINTANGCIVPPSDWVKYVNCSMNS